MVAVVAAAVLVAEASGSEVVIAVLTVWVDGVTVVASVAFPEQGWEVTQMIECQGKRTKVEVTQ